MSRCRILWCFDFFLILWYERKTIKMSIPEHQTWKLNAWANTLLVAACWSDGCTMPHTVWRRPASSVWGTLRSSLSRWARGSPRHQALTLKAGLARHPPRVEQNVADISLNRAQHLSFAFSGWTGARPSKYYVRSRREQLEAQMKRAEWEALLMMMMMIARRITRQTGGGRWAPWWAAKTWWRRRKQIGRSSIKWISYMK